MSKRITKLYSSKECFLTALRREEPEDFITHLAKLMRGGDFNRKRPPKTLYQSKRI